MEEHRTAIESEETQFSLVPESTGGGETGTDTPWATCILHRGKGAWPTHSPCSGDQLYPRGTWGAVTEEVSACQGQTSAVTAHGVSRMKTLNITLYRASAND